MENCLFCKIIAGEIPSAKVYEDETVFAFRDIAPMAPVHVLVVPKTHVANLTEAAQKLPTETLAHVMKSCAAVAEQEGIAKSGYRVITNCGQDACQSVQHLHFHVLGGTALTEKMG